MSRPFAAVESFLERILERPAARLFHAHPQPVQLERRIERAMTAQRMVVGGQTYVPSRYRIILEPSDLAALQEASDQLPAELADAILQRARSQGYRLVARPEVFLVPSARITQGDLEIDAEPLDPSLVSSTAAGLRPVGLEGPRPPRPPIPGTGVVPDPVPVVTPLSDLPVTPAADQPPAAVITPAGPPVAPAAPPAAPAAPPAAVITPAGPPAAPAAPPAAPAAPPAAWAPQESSPPPPDVFAAAQRVSPAPPIVAAGPADVAMAEPVAMPIREPAVRAVIVVQPPDRGPDHIPFEGGTVRVGRGPDNDIVVLDERVSRHHGRFAARHGVLVYTDLDSTNGSMVNGTRVREAGLGVGDVVRLGRTTLTIRPHP